MEKISAILDEEQLRQAVVDLRRDHTHVPYVVEFTGLPKAGKTTIIRRLRHVLEAQKLSVIVIGEAATERVDRSFRSDLFTFNVLCALENLASVLRAVHARGVYDVAILDRGIFDSLVWTQFLSASGLLNDEMKETISRFLLSSAWFSHVDLIAKVFVSRETYAMRAKLGSAIDLEPRFNPDYFGRLSSAYKSAMSRLAAMSPGISPKIIEWDTSVDSLLHSGDDAETRSKDCLLYSSDLYSKIAIELANLIAREIVTKNAEEIAVIDASAFKKDIRAVFSAEDIEVFASNWFGHGTVSEFETKIGRHPTPRVRYVRRDLAERDPKLLQIVAAAYLVRENKYLTMRRSAKEDRAQLRGKRTILISGHVDSKDQALAAGGRNEIENCLLREMGEELSHFDRPLVRPNFAFRMGDDEMGRRHLGVVYEVLTNSERVAVTMIPRAGAFEPDVEWLPLDVLRRDIEQFDDWSKLVIERLTKV